jgi:ectoine hydroxylase-related dioxygenase (phytanoyl-CoA dioxygenase family)
LIEELESYEMHSERRGGVRLTLTEVSIRLTAVVRRAMMSVASTVLGVEAFPVRAIYFDKTPAANWRVAWHQDLTIAVKRRANAPDFGPWSEKNGIQHVQAPATVLERMVAVRLHLDDCGLTNGPLRVIPGSHRAGRLSGEDIAEWRSRSPEVSCSARRGDAYLMRPLLVHASSQATAPAHRRVLHVEYACDALSDGLEWMEPCA